MKHIIIKIFAILVFFTVSCEKQKNHSITESELLAELNRIGIDDFVTAIDPKLGYPDVHLVNIRNTQKLNLEIKSRIAQCYVFGPIASPDGISFALEDSTYYFSIKGDNVPMFFESYKKRKLQNGVYKIYR